MTKFQWILFCPQLPATPSSPRVMVWRRMRSAGALGLDNGLWVLPHNDLNVSFAQEVGAYVQVQGGTCRVFSAQALDEATEAEILSRFQQDRAEEYFELKEQCADFLLEIEKEISRQNFSFAEYEENEQDFEKLKAWLGRVQRRDFAGGDQAEQASGWLEECSLALQRFAAEVFAHDKPDGLALARKFSGGHLNEGKEP